MLAIPEAFAFFWRNPGLTSGAVFESFLAFLRRASLPLSSRRTVTDAKTSRASEPVYNLWPCGQDRYAVSARNRVVPIWGYVSRTKDGRFWVIERAGSILPAAFCSLMQAGQAVSELRPQADRFGPVLRAVDQVRSAPRLQPG